MKAFCTALAAILTAALLPQAKADSFTFSIAGPGVGGTIALTYGTATDATYPQGLEVTGISGMISDGNNGLSLSNVPIVSLVPINHATPDPTNTLAPADFSRFPVALGTSHGSISYDNLLYPDMSPQTATDYPFAGGFLDIYGVLFTLANGDVVNVWSNGSFMGSPLNYGFAVATAQTSLDYVSGGVEATAITPEPSSFALLGTGGLAMLACWRMRTRSA